MRTFTEYNHFSAGQDRQSAYLNLTTHAETMNMNDNDIVKYPLAFCARLLPSVISMVLLSSDIATLASETPDNINSADNTVYARRILLSVFLRSSSIPEARMMPMPAVAMDAVTKQAADQERSRSEPLVPENTADNDTDAPVTR